MVESARGWFAGSITVRIQRNYMTAVTLGKSRASFWKKVFNANDRAGKGTFYYFPVGQGYEDGDGRE